MENTVIIDYGVCNVGSVKNMLHHMGIACKVSGDFSAIEAADRIILPGVGSFRQGMQMLKSKGIVDVLNYSVLERRVPVLGICLGMQMLLEYSSEGECEGLGYIRGDVRRFSEYDSMPECYKIPHMGWNTVASQSSMGILNGINEDDRFYFVHSYVVRCNNRENVSGITTYGMPFDSVIQKDNVMGVQFHPEKSLRFGMKIFRNFMDFESTKEYVI